MKRFVIAIALACVISCTAFAGDIPSVGYAPPVPDEPTQTTDLAAPGEIPSGGYTQDSSTEITLTMVQTILSLLSV